MVKLLKSPSVLLTLSAKRQDVEAEVEPNTFNVLSRYIHNPASVTVRAAIVPAFHVAVIALR